jgi:hypothetical protein
MGWFHEEHAAHEGYVVGFVARDGCAADSGLYRELGYPRDDDTRQVVECLSAGCDCGWRSPRWAPQRPAQWWPFSVAVCEADKERAHQLWRRHVELDVIAPHALRVDATAMRAELARRGERAAADLVDAGVIDLANHWVPR